ncbi:unnamed protein product, partial [Medioppia subpectinata]
MMTIPLSLFIPPPILLAHLQFGRIYQIWLHTGVVPGLGRLEYLINTPRQHRTHHTSAISSGQSGNYGGLLMIWDLYWRVNYCAIHGIVVAIGLYVVADHPLVRYFPENSVPLLIGVLFTLISIGIIFDQSSIAPLVEMVRCLLYYPFDKYYVSRWVETSMPGHLIPVTEGYGQSYHTLLPKVTDNSSRQSNRRLLYIVLAFSAWLIMIIVYTLRLRTIGGDLKIMAIPLSLIIPPPILLAHMQFGRIYQIWLHTGLVPGLGRLEYLINTPLQHRAHHRSISSGQSGNYGGLLMIWDRMFGTYIHTITRDVNGITCSGITYNVIALQCSYFYKVLCPKLTMVSGVPNNIKTLLRKPEFVQGITKISLFIDKHEIDDKYDPSIAYWRLNYCAIHGFVVTIGVYAVADHPLVRPIAPLVEMVRCLLYFPFDKYYVSRWVETSMLGYLTPFIEGYGQSYHTLLPKVTDKSNRQSNRQLLYIVLAFSAWLIMMIAYTLTTPIMDSFPDFGAGFEETALVLPYIPSLILFVTSLYEWHNRSPEVITSRGSSHPTTWTLLSITKINSSPENQSSFLSQLTFSWFTPMIMNGYRKPLTTEDMWSLSTQNRTNVFIKQFNKHWKPIQQNSAKHAINIFPVILKTYWPTLVIIGFIKLVISLLTFTQPLLLDRLITFITSQATTDTGEPVWRGYMYAGLMFVSPVLGSVLSVKYKYIENVMIMKIKACVTSAIYDKSLRLSSAGRNSHTIGDLVSLVGIDMYYLASFIMYFNNLWLSPTTVIIATWLLWAQLGAATLAGVAVMILLVPINSVVMTRENKLWRKIIELTASRVSVVAEMINNMKVLKLYAWEPAFIKRVSERRASECREVINVMVVGVIKNAITTASPYLCKVSVKRMNKYLKANEVNESFVDHKPNQRTPIIVKNASFKWDNNCDDSVLKNINIEIESQSLVAVVGRVGAGKSSLLS